ncbi:MAG: hypothetical protein KF787_10765 [Phycisphaeraceae bacterium]|nr:hypothetical protein [Phycisphaerae bacterium]MBX3393116.1 hypothetical protein [Phycisphaeraceae bacterium]HRJ49720.1 hypothetical protein [Phycisphaerales bacterium]
MRLPLSKIYRAFPELDSFTDDQCVRYVAAARKGWPSRLLAALACLGTLLLTIITLGIVVGLAMEMDSHPLLMAAVLFAIFPSGVLAAMIVRDAFLRAWLRRRILNATCGGCGYSLLGLSASMSQAGLILRCPECGGENELAQRGLTVAEVGALAMRRSAHEQPPS